MSSIEYSVDALLDALDDLEDGIQYVREIAEGLIYGHDDLLEEEDKSDTEDEPETEEHKDEQKEEKSEEKTEKDNEK